MIPAVRTPWFCTQAHIISFLSYVVLGKPCFPTRLTCVYGIYDKCGNVPATQWPFTTSELQTSCELVSQSGIRGGWQPKSLSLRIFKDVPIWIEFSESIFFFFSLFIILCKRDSENGITSNELIFQEGQHERTWFYWFWRWRNPENRWLLGARKDKEIAVPSFPPNLHPHLWEGVLPWWYLFYSSDTHVWIVNCKMINLCGSHQACNS